MCISDNDFQDYSQRDNSLHGQIALSTQTLYSTSKHKNTVLQNVLNNPNPFLLNNLPNRSQISFE